MKDNFVLERAKKNGYYSVLLLLVSFAVQPYLAHNFPEKTLLFTTTSALAMFLILYTYSRMMQGVLTIAKESESSILTSSTQSFIKASIISCIVIALMPIISELIPAESVSLITLISTILSLVYLGVASLKISKGFQILEAKYTQTAKRAVFWHKITGYLLVSVILSIVGVITSLIADYYMWRLISVRLKESTTPNQTNDSN